MLTLKHTDGRLGVEVWIRFHLMGTMLLLEGLVGYQSTLFEVLPPWEQRYRAPHSYPASENKQYP